MEETTETAPELVETPAPVAPVVEAPVVVESQQTVEAWAKAKKTTPVDFAMAKRKHRWAIGVLKTEAEYDAAIAAGRSIVLR